MIDSETCTDFLRFGKKLPRIFVIQAHDGERGETLRTLDGGRTEDYLLWLLDLKEKFGNAVFTGYFFRLDAEHIFADIGQKKLRRLVKSGKVYFETPQHFFEIRYVPNKWLGISELRKSEDQSRRPETIRSITIDDVSGFFQTSFVKALTKWAPECVDLDFIRDMKARRSEFKVDQIDEVERYNGLECQWGAVVMRRVNAAARRAGIRLTRFYGAGAGAADVLREHKVSQAITVPLSYHTKVCMLLDRARAKMERYGGERSPEARRAYGQMKKLELESMRPPHPDELEHFGQVAFFGGRNEQVRYGLLRDQIYSYDVNSQYPTAIRLLPDLTKGRWLEPKDLGLGRAEYLPDQPFALYQVEWDLPHTRAIYPFPFREGSAVYFPPMGRCWLWAPEVGAALESGGFPEGSIRLLDARYFVPSEESRPFAFVNDLAAYRLRLKHEGDPGNILLKLCGLNSLFGKTKQERSSRAGIRPTYYSILWAGWITSFGRAMVYRAARSRGDASEREIVMFATDGILSTAPLPLPTGERLGEWEHEVYDAGQFVLAGCYRLAKGDKWAKVRTRSYPEKDYPWDEVLTRWKAGRSDDIPITVRQFVTLSYVVQTGRWWEWRTFKDTEKRVAIAMRTTESKREDLVDCRSWSKDRNPSLGLMETIAFDPCAAYRGEPYDSAPYQRDRVADMDDGEFHEWVTDTVMALTARDSKRKLTPEQREAAREISEVEVDAISSPDIPIACPKTRYHFSSTGESTS